MTSFVVIFYSFSFLFNFSGIANLFEDPSFEWASWVGIQDHDVFNQDKKNKRKVPQQKNINGFEIADFWHLRIYCTGQQKCGQDCSDAERDACWDSIRDYPEGAPRENDKNDGGCYYGDDEVLQATFEGERGEKLRKVACECQKAKV